MQTATLGTATKPRVTPRRGRAHGRRAAAAAAAAAAERAKLPCPRVLKFEKLLLIYSLYSLDGAVTNRRRRANLFLLVAR
jgi:hypothetical protein